MGKERRTSNIQHSTSNVQRPTSKSDSEVRRLPIGPPSAVLRRTGDTADYQSALLIQRPMPNIEVRNQSPASFRVQRWKLEVGCWTFVFVFPVLALRRGLGAVMFTTSGTGLPHASPRARQPLCQPNNSRRVIQESFLEIVACVHVLFVQFRTSNIQRSTSNVEGGKVVGFMNYRRRGMRECESLNRQNR